MTKKRSNRRSKRRRTRKFGINYRMFSGMPGLDSSIMFEKYILPNNKDVKFVIKKGKYLGCNGDRNYYVYEYKFQKIYPLIYTMDYCGKESETDKISHDWNKKNIGQVEYIDEYGNSCYAIAVTNSNILKIAAHEGGHFS